MPYSTLFWSIYTSSVCSLMYNKEILILRESKKSKYYLGNPMLKTKLLGIQSVRKNIQCTILLCFGVYTPTPYALSCKIQKFYIKGYRKNI